jgi:hypothetical protein
MYFLKENVMSQAQVVSASADSVPPELERGKHRPFATLASVPRVVEDPPLSPDELAALKAITIGFLPGEEPAIDADIMESSTTPPAPRILCPTLPKFPKGVGTNMREFLFHGLDRGVIPECGKFYGGYAPDANGAYATLIIGARRREGVVYVRVFDVSGEIFRPLEVLRDRKTELAYELVRNPGAIRNKDLRKRVGVLSEFFWSLVRKMESTGGKKQNRQTKRS